jgi:hypothetical protein
MPYTRIPGLPRSQEGYARILNADHLSILLSWLDADLSAESIDFGSPSWLVADEAEKILTCRFLNAAHRQVCTAGRFPQPQAELPKIGVRAEAMVLGGKPSPSSRYGTGTVTGLGWDSVFRYWRINMAINIRFNEQTGAFYGTPIVGTSTLPFCVHVVGGPDRPFPSMTPTEIEELHEPRCQAFWRDIDPLSGLTDQPQRRKTMRTHRTVPEGRLAGGQSPK